MLIGENLHIISKRTKEAIFERDSDYVLDNIKKQFDNGIRTVDLNIGPAKGRAADSLVWLIELISGKYDVNFSLDTTNLEEMKKGFSCLKNTKDAFLNSTSADEEKLKNTVQIASKYDANLIALTMSAQTGIPKTPDERMELAFNIIEETSQNGIDNSKVWIDPLILPVCAAQEQAVISLDTIRMIKESFDPGVKTLIRLSNISNGCPGELRPHINRTFFALALGCGLDGAIVDGFDMQTLEVYNIIKTKEANSPAQEMYLKLYDTMLNFGDIEDIKYDKGDALQYKIYRCAAILLNREIYSHSFV